MDNLSVDHFVDSSHALAAGIILGALMREAGDGESYVKHVQPLCDSEGNYTRQMIVQIGDRSFTLTVDDSLEEAMREA